MTADIERGRHVIGAGSKKCERMYVYEDAGHNLTLMADDRIGGPFGIVDRYLSPQQCDVAPLTEEQLIEWHRKWCGYGEANEETEFDSGIDWSDEEE